MRHGAMVAAAPWPSRFSTVCANWLWWSLNSTVSSVSCAFTWREVPQPTVVDPMGRHSNLLLLDDQKRITAIGRQVRQHQSGPPVAPVMSTHHPQRYRDYHRALRSRLINGNAGSRCLDSPRQSTSGDLSGISRLATQLTAFPGSLDSQGTPLMLQQVNKISDRNGDGSMSAGTAGCAIWMRRRSLQMEGSGFRVWNDPPAEPSSEAMLSLRLGAATKIM